MTHTNHNNEYSKPINQNPPSGISQSPHRKKKKTTGTPWFDEPYNPVRGETAIWIAVITQAMMDALSRSKNPELIFHKNEAIYWLTENSRDFIEVCLLAGLDPDYVRRRAKRALLSPVEWRAAPGKGLRYLERKTYRQKQQKKSAASLSPDENDVGETVNNIIPGPW